MTLESLSAGTLILTLKMWVWIVLIFETMWHCSLGVWVSTVHR